MLRDALLHDRLGRFLQRLAAADQAEPFVEEPHTRLDVAAVVRAERQDAGRHAVLERRAGGRDVARRERRRRHDAVVERRHEHRVQHAADRRRRQLAHEQEIDRFGEAEPPHHLVHGIPADEDLVRRDLGERRLPPVRLLAAAHAPIGQHRFRHDRL